MVYYSAPYGIGAAAVRIGDAGNPAATNELWRTRTRRNHWATPVHYAGYLYGPFGYGGDSPDYVGHLQCLDLRDGTVKWTQTDIKNGAVLIAGGLLLALTQEGVVVLIQPDPAAYRELGRFKAVKGLCWNAPALSDERLYVRSTYHAACFDLAPSTPPKLRLQAERPVPGEPFHWRIGTDDGSKLDSNRQFRIRVWGASTLDSGTNDWRRLTNDPLYLNGELQVDDADSLTLPHRFYRTEETP